MTQGKGMTAEEYPTKKVLDHGFVRLVDHMGNDQRIIDAARVSYQKGTKRVSSDRGLIRYLLRHFHTTPFEKIRFEWHVKLPIFVARQWMRHRMSSYNEISARYSVLTDEFYVPEVVRKQSPSNRQGSINEPCDDITLIEFTDDGEGYANTIAARELIEENSDICYANYQHLLEAGAARELARTTLPLNIYTEFYWTIDLWNLMHFLRLRKDSHAQKEIQLYGNAIHDMIIENCDLEMAMEAFQDYILDAPGITKYEMAIIKNIVEKLSGRSFFDEDIKEMIQEEIEENKQMGKREKDETKLFKLLGV